MQNLGEKIKEHIDKSGVSQSNLAKKLGISRQHLHDILKENRKSKYLHDLAQILNIPKFDDLEFIERTQIQNRQLPILSLDDLIHFIEGDYSINHLYKPFYKDWPFYEPKEVHSHFCLRLSQEFAWSLNSYVLGAFQFCIFLNLKPDTIIVVYFAASKKVLTGYLQINPETNERFLMCDGRIDMIGKNTWIMAQCTQLINLFEQDA